MYIRNFEHPAPEHFEDYTGLQKNARYPLPNYFKYIAWFFVGATVLTSSTVLIIYGMSFGLIKIYVWLTVFAMTFLFHIFITIPVKIFFCLIINSFCLKRKPVIIQRKINPCLLWNPDVPVKRARILRFREFNAKLYCPTPFHKIQSRCENIRHNAELRNIVADIFFYIIFLLAGVYIVLIHKSPLAYYCNEIIMHNILNASYTNSIKFSEIKTYETFLQYLNTTLLPMLLNPKEKSLDNSTHRSKRSWYNTWGYRKRPPDNFKKGQVLDDFNRLHEKKKDLFNRGWTMNSNLKLLGRARLRQIRVKPEPCFGRSSLKVRSSECGAELNLFNVETDNFTLEWKPYSEKGLSKEQAMPWIHQSSWESGSLPTLAKFAAYPGGGYILELPKSFHDALTVLEFLDTFQWVDAKTRVVFIEFTLYCANTNMFSVIALIAERSAAGYFVLSHKILTWKFIFLPRDFRFGTVFMSSLFFSLFFVYLFRESLRIHRTSFKHYFKRASMLIDLAVVFFGLSSLFVQIFGAVHVGLLMKKLEQSKNNEFVSFIFAASWATLAVHFESILVFLVFIKAFRGLGFRAVVYKFQNALKSCFTRLLSLYFKQFYLTIAFALFFYLLLVNFSIFFSSLRMSVLTMAGEIFRGSIFDLEMFRGSLTFIPVFLIMFLSYISTLLLNTFVSVFCVYFHSIRTVRFPDKYNVSDFIKHWLTSRKQNDLLHIAEGNAFGKKLNESFVLRLKGGGNKLMKMKMRGCENKLMKKKMRSGGNKLMKMKMRGCGNKLTKKKKRKDTLQETETETENQAEVQKVHLREFVTRKVYDSTMYMHLHPDRAAALRSFMILYLTVDEEERKVFCEKSLVALFYTYIMDETDRTRLKNEPGKYFFVTRRHETEAYDKQMFVRMKKVVEEVGIEQGLVATLEEEVAREIDGCENCLAVLEEKLDLLMRKLRSSPNARR